MRIARAGSDKWSNWQAETTGLDYLPDVQHLRRGTCRQRFPGFGGMTGLIEVSFTERGHRGKSRCGVRGSGNDEAVSKVLNSLSLNFMSNTTAGSSKWICGPETQKQARTWRNKFARQHKVQFFEKSASRDHGEGGWAIRRKKPEMTEAKKKNWTIWSRCFIVVFFFLKYPILFQNLQKHRIIPSVLKMHSPREGTWSVVQTVERWIH